VKYSRIFISTATLVFDLAPYLDYLPEFGSDVQTKVPCDIFTILKSSSHAKSI